MLQKAGYSINIVGTGKQAVQAVFESAYHLVFMDVQMPEMDGLEATRRIRAQEIDGRHTPIVAMTAHAMVGDRERCLEAGMDDYLSKPLEPAEVFAALERWLPAIESDEGAQAVLPVETDVTPNLSGDPVDVVQVMPRFGGDRSFFLTMLGEFVVDFEERLRLLQTAIEQRQLDELARQAHNLKGAASNFNAEPLTTYARQLESEARAGEWEHAAVSLAQIEVEFPRLRTYHQRQTEEQV
jgi:CheY-like chemotaxis protein/HPt (histidine-containing phosphotransfer) domain-containing protein